MINFEVVRYTDNITRIAVSRQYGIFLKLDNFGYIVLYSGIYFFYHLKKLVALVKERGGVVVDAVIMATNKMSADQKQDGSGPTRLSEKRRSGRSAMKRCRSPLH